MEKKYSINEIVRFAIEMEKEGQLFYQKMADKTEQNDLKDMYLQLKEDEIQHQKTYEDMLAELDSAAEQTYGLENEYVAYLHSMIENTVFDDSKQDAELADLADDLSVIEYAIKKEQVSVDFYKNLKPLVVVDKQEQINRIIDEEQLHIIKLLDYKEKIDE